MVDIFKGIYAKVHEINERYKHPRIHHSKTVEIALLMLRIYLIFSVALLVFKFVQTLKGG
jgi:hypothetical protein